MSTTGEKIEAAAKVAKEVYNAYKVIANKDEEKIVFGVSRTVDNGDGTEDIIKLETTEIKGEREYSKSVQTINKKDGTQIKFHIISSPTVEILYNKINK